MLDKIIKEKLPKTAKGIYIISYLDAPEGNKNKLKRVKIGISASSILKRLDQYHTCFSDSFYTWSCIVVRDEINKPEILRLEKQIHTALKKYLYKHSEYDARNPGEWFEVSMNILKSTVENVIAKNNSLVKYVVNFQPQFQIVHKV